MHYNHLYSYSYHLRPVTCSSANMFEARLQQGSLLKKVRALHQLPPSSKQLRAAAAMHCLRQCHDDLNCGGLVAPAVGLIAGSPALPGL